MRHNAVMSRWRPDLLSLRLFVTVPAAYADARAGTDGEDEGEGEGRQDAIFEILSGDRTRVVETAFDYGSADR